MTNKLELRSIEQFMADYQPVYQPLYPLFLGNSVSYAEQVGDVKFKRLEAVGDIRQKHYTPKDTEIKQIGVKESSKTFKKYFLANQFTQSALQEQGRVEDIVRQVLDEHQKQADDLFLLGEGTSDGTVVNNGLFYSGDSNHTTESSVEIAAGSDHLIDFHKRVMANVSDADDISGRKVIIFYGTEVLSYFDANYASQPVPFKRTLKEAVGENYSFAKMPKAVTPAGVNGWIIANLDQTKLHYSALPSLKAQGVNDEKMYAWFNFMMGSMMLEVIANGAVLRQPATIGA